MHAGEEVRDKSDRAVTLGSDDEHRQRGASCTQRGLRRERSAAVERRMLPCARAPTSARAPRGPLYRPDAFRIGVAGIRLPGYHARQPPAVG